MAHPLRNRDFRFVALAAALLIFGFEMRAIAQSWIALELTDSQAWVGAVNGVPAFSMIVFSLLGGVAADRLPKRDILIVAQAIMAGLAFVVGYLVAAELINVWHLLALALVQGGFVAFALPANQSFIIEIVGRDRLVSATSLMQATEMTGLVIGPGLAGVLIGVAGVAEVYFFVGGIAILSLVLMVLVKNRTVHERDAAKSVWQDISEGLKFTITDRVIRILMSLNVLAIFAGFVMPIIPVYARDVLKVGEAGFGLMMACMGAGGVVATAALAVAGDRLRKGPLLIWGAALFGIGVVLFAFSREFYLSLVLLGLMGVAGVAYVISITVLVQMQVSDEMRGRVMGLFGMSMQLFPLGFLFGGVLAAATSNEVALVVGGLGTAIPPVFAYLASATLREAA